MTFLANPHLILQTSHAKTFKMKYTRCPYNIIHTFIKSQRPIMCGSNFYVSDVSSWTEICDFVKTTIGTNSSWLTLKALIIGSLNCVEVFRGFSGFLRFIGVYRGLSGLDY